MSTKVITPRCLLSYPHLREPSADPQGKMKYSVALLFPEGSDLSQIKAAIIEAAQGRFGNKAVDMLKSGALRNPIRTDVEAKGYDAFGVIAFMNVRSNNAPGIVGPYAGKDGKPAPWDDEIYPGIAARVSMNAFAYATSGNKGVSFGLNNVQILDNSTPRIDNRLSATDEFDVTEERQVAEMPEDVAAMFG